MFIMCLGCYNMFIMCSGCYGACERIFESMEIKHVQHDAISYLVTNDVLRLGHLNAAHNRLGYICNFFTYNYKDVSN